MVKFGAINWKVGMTMDWDFHQYERSQQNKNDSKSYFNTFERKKCNKGMNLKTNANFILICMTKC